jgi:trimethylamine--corrinoid protein Co-methyltransferase
LNQIKYHLTGGLSAAQLDILHDHAMSILGAMGMEIAHAETLAFLRDRPGFNIDGDRVRISRGILDECVAAVRRRRKPPAEKAANEWELHILPGCPMHLADWRTGQVRPMTTEDAIGMARLVDVLHDRGVRGTSPGVPQDVPPEIQPIRAFRIGAENCRAGGACQVSSPAHAAWIQRLMEVMGQKYCLEVWILNPLRADPETFGRLYQLRDKPVNFSVGCMPLMGVSAPVQIIGAFTVSLASVWGAYAVAREVTGREDIWMDCRVWPVNMRTLEIVFGTPEMILADLVTGQLREFYGWGGDDGCAFHSSVPFPDRQAAAQRGAYGMAMALAGRRRFCWGGLLGVDLVFSPEQLLLDLEMLDYYRHLAKGFASDEDKFCLDAIRAAGPAGSFLGDTTTLHGYREVFWQPHLMSLDSLANWRVKGSPTAAEWMGREIEELITRHDYRLSEDKAKELDRLCRAAEDDLLAPS